MPPIHKPAVHIVSQVTASCTSVPGRVTGYISCALPETFNVGPNPKRHRLIGHYEATRAVESEEQYASWTLVVILDPKFSSVLKTASVSASPTAQEIGELLAAALTSNNRCAGPIIVSASEAPFFVESVREAHSDQSQ